MKKKAGEQFAETCKSSITSRGQQSSLRHIPDDASLASASPGTQSAPDARVGQASSRYGLASRHGRHQIERSAQTLVSGLARTFAGLSCAHFTMARRHRARKRFPRRHSSLLKHRIAGPDARPALRAPACGARSLRRTRTPAARIAK